MVRCGTCGNALCACRIYQDGAVLLVGNDGAFVAANPESRDGRRTTVVVGNGTPGSPYEITFIDSLDYQPQVGELRRDTADVVGPAGGRLVEFEFALYSTPSDRPLMLFEPIGFPDDANMTSLEWIFWGASARFAGGALGQNKMMVRLNGRFWGGHTTQFRSGMTTSVLTASGFVNPLQGIAAAAIGGLVGSFEILYSSVDPLVSASFWATTT